MDFTGGVRMFADKAEQTVAMAAETRLRHSPYLELRQVECSCTRGILTLSGQVSSYYLRQVAQTQVQDIDGVRGILNELVVVEKAGALQRSTFS